MGGLLTDASPPVQAYGATNGTGSEEGNGTDNESSRSGSESEGSSSRPHATGGMILTVDGERIDYGVLQGELVPGLALLMGLPSQHSQ